MGQGLRRLWERVQGRPHLRKICDKIFDQVKNDKGLLPLSELHCSVLLVFNLLNKHFPGTHKDPPSTEVVNVTVKQFHSEKLEEIDRERFYLLILQWTAKDRRLLVINKFLLALLAAPALAEITKTGGDHVPSIRNVIQKIPTPVFITVYTLGLVLVQDFIVSVD